MLPLLVLVVVVMNKRERASRLCIKHKGMNLIAAGGRPESQPSAAVAADVSEILQRAANYH